MDTLWSVSTEWLRPLAIITGGIVAGLVLHWLAFVVLGRVSGRTPTTIDDTLLANLRRPARLVVVLIVVKLTVPLLELPAAAQAVVNHLASIALITAVTWSIIAVTRAGRDILRDRYDVTAVDNLEARKVHTQYDVLSKIVVSLAVTVGIACALMTFDQVRQLGAGILASAGLMGLVVGFAAQKSLATLLAGIQLAITQPIRLDDVVVVEGEWGRIEEITLTYVVVKIWDQRRLVLPVTYFLEQPFQNWTRVSAELLGTINLSLDITVPIDPIRAELQRIVENDERWDGRVAQVVMTDVTDRTVTLRALISATDSGKAWDLRCEVREKLVAYVRDHHPETLPRLRTEVTSWPRAMLRS